MLVAKPPTYPNYVLHPEVIPSLNEVPAELIKRRNIRFTDPSTLDSFETEIPLAIASSLQDELERAVQHRLVILFLFHFVFHISFVYRVAQDRNADQNGTATPANSEVNLFQALGPEQSYPTMPFSESVEFTAQHSLPRPSIHEKSSLGESFQRIKIAGDFNDMSHIEDLEDAVGPLLRAMVIREKYIQKKLKNRISNLIFCSIRYMIFSLQSFPPSVAKFLTTTLEQEDQSRRVSSTIRANTGLDPSQAPISSSSSSSSLISSVKPY